jgi:hypothetical protein
MRTLLKLKGPGMTDIVEDLRAMAANPGGYTKAEVIELLMKAADTIETDRAALVKSRGGVIEASATWTK